MENRDAFELGPVYFLSVAVVIIMFGASAYVWSQTPGGAAAQICTNSNAAGECIDRSGKLITLLALPILLAVLVGVFPILARIEPRQLHFAQSRKTFGILGAVIMLYFLVVHTVQLLNILGRAANAATYWPILAGLVLLILGNYLGKIRSNSFIGFRTPWTLESERSWNKTHRLGGKMLFLLGLAMFVGSLVIAGEVWVYVLMIASILWVVVLVIYSYVIWRDDQSRSSSESSTVT